MSDLKRVPMTPKGHQHAKEELDHLVSVEREAVIRAIADARSHGDLKENAEYHTAKDKQGHIEGRIRYLQSQLSHAQIIDTSKMKANDKVIFGAHVVLQAENSDDTITYQIVGEDESDFKAGKLSFLSPIARALMGKSTDDYVTVKTPSGEKGYDIIDITY
jgi:transcription elongation factor GreA